MRYKYIFLVTSNSLLCFLIALLCQNYPLYLFKFLSTIYSITGNFQTTVPESIFNSILNQPENLDMLHKNCS